MRKVMLYDREELLRRVEKSAEAERNIKTMADTAIDRAALDITEQ